MKRYVWLAPLIAAGIVFAVFAWQSRQQTRTSARQANSKTVPYQFIVEDLNQRYILGYYPINKDRDGKRRRIKVEVKGHPEYSITSRKSYYQREE